MRLAPLISLVGLLSAIASAAGAHGDTPQVVFYAIQDDWVRGQIGAYRAAGFDDLSGDPVAETLTPFMDAIAADGVMLAYQVGGAACTVARNMALGYGSAYRPTNLAGAVFGTSTQGHQSDVRIDLTARNIVRAMKERGYLTWHYGKEHSSGPNREQQGLPGSGLKEQGWDVAKYVILGTPSLNSPLESFGTHPDKMSTDEESCLSQNFWVSHDLGGNAVRNYGYTTNVIIDGLITDLSAWLTANGDDGHVFIQLAPTAPHFPWQDGTGTGGVDDHCAQELGGPEIFFADSRPPLGTASGDEEVYAEQLEHLDTKMGEFYAILDETKHLGVFFTDNGVPSTMDIPLECMESYGVKGTPYFCGLFVPSIWWGQGITPGVMTDLHGIEDIPKTILSMVGANPLLTNDGVDYSDCLTSSNGQTLATCTRSREVVGSAQWNPLGGMAGTIADRGPIRTDPAGTHLNWVFGPWTKSYGSNLHMIHQRFDTTTQPAGLCQSLHIVAPTQDYQTHPDNGGNQPAIGTCGVPATTPAGGTIDCDGVWDTGGTADDIAACHRLQRHLVEMEHRNGAERPLMVGSF